ncbi:MAG: hypothetical protein WC517_03095 [Patescibacteria group bacterium]
MKKLSWIVDGDIRNADPEMQYVSEFQPTQLERISDIAEEIQALKLQVDSQADSATLKGLTKATAIAAVLAIAVRLLRP